jgi:hypothetical protein
MRRKLENAEEESHRRASESSEAQTKLAQEQMVKADALQQQVIKLKEENDIRIDETKRYIAELGKDDTGLTDTTSDEESQLDRDKFDLDVTSKSNDHMIKVNAQNNDMIKHQGQMELGKESNAISRIQKKKTSST